ncbi:Protein CBG21592 [Caenorhabditis briggsae]|uniref:Protein CBG21592 n=1 Tax=Caenorhabditis briggsae TaxID=6238 RepID=A8Y0G4_CAEBR|nr:Protein CBG21592 [Caenorhabditis briggsae]CAP38349.2 Protein CBG21592 [Caenorhabditis briggsae]
MNWKLQSFNSGESYGGFIQKFFNGRIPFREAHRRLLQEIGNDTSDMDQSSPSSSTQRPGIKRVSSPIGAPEEPRPSKMNRQEEPEAPIPEEHPRNEYEQQLFVQRWERERVSYYAGIYDPQHEFPHQVNHIIQIGQIRDFYEELMLAGMDSCPRDAENFRLAEIANIWDLRNDQGKEEVKYDNRTVEYNTPSYKILAACDFYFIIRMSTLSLKRLGIKIDPLPDNMPQGDVRFVDISMLKIITGLISDKKPNRLRVTKFSYMFSRESDVLDEAPIQLDPFIYLLEDRELKTVKLRAWDDRMVLQANNYPNMVRNCLMRRHSVQCALPRWTNVETLDIRDEIVFMADEDFTWEWVYFFPNILLPRLSGNDVWNAQRNLQLEGNEYQQYTVICSQDLNHDEILEAYIRSDIQGKFENHPALGFPLKHTRIKGDGNTYVLEMIPKQIKFIVRATMEDD